MSALIRRRQFLKAAAAVGLGAFAHAAPAAAPTAALVLIELNGGNDGLNTLIPFRQAAYARLRPRLRIAQDDVVQLDPRVGMHPGLAPLKPAWDAGELAWVQGVGYTPPNRSHFRSIEIWDTASTREVIGATGWIAQAFAEHGFVRRGPIDAMVLGRPYNGPVAGAHMRSIHMRDPERFLRRASQLRAVETSTSNAALAHVLRIRRALSASAAGVKDALARQAPIDTHGFEGPLGKQLAIAARMIQAQAGVGVYKLSHSGYDTHAGQLGRHRALLAELGRTLAAFRTQLVSSGHWHHTVLATYSEFGRRVAQNGANGSDHGTAAPHLLLGGSVTGGLYGSYPSLENLDGGDLRATTHMTDYYATIAKNAWGNVPRVLGKARPLA